MTVRSVEDHANALAAFLPNGRTFEAKNIDGSIVRGLVKGLAGELFTAQGYLTTLDEQYIPDASNLDTYLNEWEQALAIPDGCFTGTGTTVDRWIAVLTKLAALGVQTIEDFEALAVTFGVTVSIQTGVDSGLSFDNDPTGRFTIVVSVTLPDRFTYTFPIAFGNAAIVLLECIFEKLKPGNCQVVFQEI